MAAGSESQRPMGNFDRTLGVNSFTRTAKSLPTASHRGGIPADRSAGQVFTQRVAFTPQSGWREVSWKRRGFRPGHLSARPSTPFRVYRCPSTLRSRTIVPSQVKRCSSVAVIHSPAPASRPRPRVGDLRVLTPILRSRFRIDGRPRISPIISRLPGVPFLEAAFHRCSTHLHYVQRGSILRPRDWQTADHGAAFSGSEAQTVPHVPCDPAHCYRATKGCKASGSCSLAPCARHPPVGHSLYVQRRPAAAASAAASAAAED